MSEFGRHRETSEGSVAEELRRKKRREIECAADRVRIDELRKKYKRNLRQKNWISRLTMFATREMKRSLFHPKMRFLKTFVLKQRCFPPSQHETFIFKRQL